MSEAKQVAKEKVYVQLAWRVEAVHNCQKQRPVNTAWLSKHVLAVQFITENHLPHGSGIDNGCKVDFGKSTSEKLVIDTGFHHMNVQGVYDGWTRHTIIVTPSFTGINIRITGRNRNDIKEYLHQAFYEALTEEQLIVST